MSQPMSFADEIMLGKPGEGAIRKFYRENVSRTPIVDSTRERQTAHPGRFVGMTDGLATYRFDGK